MQRPREQAKTKNQISLPIFLGGVQKHRDIEKLLFSEISKVPKKALEKPMVVFAGRSNVGKSTLLNKLTGKKIARVSQTPGKTKEINFFLFSFFGAPRLLVDLPGYGYAKVAKSLKKEWGSEIQDFLLDPLYRKVVVMLADGRHGLFEPDIELLDVLQQNNLSYAVAFTKMDKWKSRNQRLSAQRQLLEVKPKFGVAEVVFLGLEEIDPLKAMLRVLA